jgi:hypothetical protein
MFHRTASSDLEAVYGPYKDFQRRVASNPQSKSNLVDIFPFFTNLIRGMARTYDISDDPANYVFAQVRALHADKVNGNGDRARTSELIQYRPNLGTFVYLSFVGKPHLEEHDATDVRTSHGILVHSTLDLSDPARPVRVLLAVDKKKDKEYADNLQAGRSFAYSMGCLAQYCQCDFCKNIATTDEEWCEHMRHHKGRYVKGQLMSESMYGVEYEELSRVASPADKGAVRERVLSTASPAMESVRMTLRSVLGSLPRGGLL